MVRKAIDKSHKQNVKQEVNVRIHLHEDKKKKGKKGKAKRQAKPSKANHHSHNPYAQSYNPVYIQSGNAPHLEPPAPSNPLLGQIHDLIKNIKKEHIETPENSLLKSVKKERTIQNVKHELKQEYPLSENEPFLKVESDSESDEDEPLSENEEEKELVHDTKGEYSFLRRAIREEVSPIKQDETECSSLSLSTNKYPFHGKKVDSAEKLREERPLEYDEDRTKSHSEFPSTPLPRGKYYKYEDEESPFNDKALRDEKSFFLPSGGVSGYEKSNIFVRKGRPKKYHTQEEAQAAKNAASKRYYDTQKALRASIVDVSHLKKGSEEEL